METGGIHRQGDHRFSSRAVARDARASAEFQRWLTKWTLRLGFWVAPRWCSLFILRGVWRSIGFTEKEIARIEKRL